jgi:glycosyltransferase involved in cell wall biosynthesis
MEVSIITVNKNDCRGLNKTIESVVNQNYSDFEYIIIDGASTDGSVELIKRHENRLGYWVSEEDSGIYSAMNKGIRQSSGTYCFFINSGDYLFDENVLESIIMKLNDKDIVYGNIIVYDATQKHYITYPDEVTFRDLYSKSIPHSGGSFIKRELLIKNGFYNENYKIVSDWEFFIKAIVFGNASTLHLDSFISYFNLQGISSQNLELMHAERRRVLESIIPGKILTDYDKIAENESNKSDLSFLQLCTLLTKKIWHLKS